MSKLAVCLLTCDRHIYTATCVKTFVEQNRAQFDTMHLLHCDGGSLWQNNVRIAQRAGFRTLIAPKREDRIGQMACLRIFLEEAARLGSEWILWLENDWESVKPLPDAEWLAQCDADTVRLFGEMKFRGGHRAKAGEHRIGTSERIAWVPLRAGWEFGYAHWGAGGTLVRRSVLERQLHAERLKDVITADLRLLNWRPTENIMFSIGEETTAGFMG